jgi:D-alanyl-D-alanine endopeptidase (penicillin-binding protein 7)
MRSIPTGRLWAPFLALLLACVPLQEAAAKGKRAEAKPSKRVTMVIQLGGAKKITATKAARAKAAARAAAPVIEPLQLVDGKPLLKASVAYVVDQETGEVLLGKNDEDVRPIASLTKLMTGVVVSDARLPLDEQIVITEEDVDRVKHSSSRLRVGTQLTRGEALHLALMSSENRAAHALARTYPGGESAFVAAMNNIARQLGMDQTRYVEPTGLSSRNQSSARDLALLTASAYQRPLLREFSTSPGYRLDSLRYVNTNRLVRDGDWRIGVQKTGYINEAGQCLLLQAHVAGRKLIMVFLDSASKVTRIKDAETVRRWVATDPAVRHSS